MKPPRKWQRWGLVTLVIGWGACDPGAHGTRRDAGGDAYDQGRAEDGPAPDIAGLPEAVIVNPKESADDYAGVGARALCSDGERFFVAWTERPVSKPDGSSSPREILYVAVLDHEGAVQQPAMEVHRLEEGEAKDLSIHCTGDNTAALWYRHMTGRSGPIIALRVTVLVTGAIAISPVTSILPSGDIYYLTASLSVTFSNGYFGALCLQARPYFVLATQELLPLIQTQVGDSSANTPSLLEVPATTESQRAFQAFWTQTASGTVQLHQQRIDVTLPATLESLSCDTLAVHGKTRAWGDGSTAVLLSWEGTATWSDPVFLYQQGSENSAPSWNSELNLVGYENRYEPMPYSAGLDQDTAIVAWQSNAQTALSQIYYRTVDLNATEDAITGQVNDDPGTLLTGRPDDPHLGTYKFVSPILGRIPNLAGGPDGWAVLFSGVINGADTLFFKRLER